MRIQLRFFAAVREALGSAEELLTVPAQVQTADEVRRFLCERGGVWADTLAEGRVLRMAVNHQMAAPDTHIDEACELAFFPPVTGG